jgi:hypothetical protein
MTQRTLPQAHKKACSRAFVQATSSITMADRFITTGLRREVLHENEIVRVDHKRIPFFE